MRSFAVTLLFFCGLFGICWFRYAPPPVRGLDAAPTAFSAARAREVQRAVVGEGLSREIGSEANARTRELLQTTLISFGWQTEVQSATLCSRYGTCGAVQNLIATRTGADPAATAVLLMAHYDSVRCGPGAGDDGFGVAAVVEAARALAVGPALRRTVIVVLTDGEESGLLGAEAFIHRHPLGRTVRGVVNVDSRGSGGPSAMFETTAGNGWVVGLVARTIEHPVTSSLFYEIYRRMPNDTDFSSVKSQAQGVNFANIAQVERYHTPFDSLDNADPRTLQDHGDHVLGMVRALANAGVELDRREPGEDAVWFDVLATFIVRWPAKATLGLAATALGLVLGWAIRMRAWRSGLRGFVAPLAALVGALLGAFALGSLLQGLGALPVPWIAHPLPALISMHGTCIAVGLLAARLVAGPSSSPEALWAGTWLAWGTLGVLVAIFAPGASFLFVVPTLLAGFAAWLRIDVAAAIPALAAAIVWLPLAFLVYDGLGFIAPVVVSISSAMLVSTVPVLWLGDVDAGGARRRLLAGTGALVGAATLVALAVPTFSQAVPQRVNVVFREDAAAAQVYVDATWGGMAWGKPPEPMVRALGEPRRVTMRAPWPWSALVPTAEVARVALPPPTAVVTTEGAGKRIHLRSQRGASSLAIVVASSAELTFEVEGQAVVPRRGLIILQAVPAAGIDVLATPRGRAPVVLTIADVTAGLPPRVAAPIAQAVLEARPASAVQTQEGDSTIVTMELEL